jgi:hypothetical protein
VSGGNGQGYRASINAISSGLSCRDKSVFWFPTDLRMNYEWQMTSFLSERPLIYCSCILGKYFLLARILGNVYCLLVSTDKPVDFTATRWFPRIYNFHFRILGNVFAYSFRRNGSTCHNTYKYHLTLPTYQNCAIFS